MLLDRRLFGRDRRRRRRRRRGRRRRRRTHDAVTVALSRLRRAALDDRLALRWRVAAYGAQSVRELGLELLDLDGQLLVAVRRGAELALLLAQQRLGLVEQRRHDRVLLAGGRELAVEAVKALVVGLEIALQQLGELLEALAHGRIHLVNRLGEARHDALDALTERRHVRHERGVTLRVAVAQRRLKRGVTLLVADAQRCFERVEAARERVVVRLELLEHGRDLVRVDVRRPRRRKGEAAPAAAAQWRVEAGRGHRRGAYGLRRGRGGQVR